MKRRNKRMLPLLLAVVTMLGCLLPGTLPVQVNAAEYENTYVNTGNQRKDIIGVALTQVGYTEGENNDTKYGSWYGLPYQPWCATFISWCARQAEISTNILQKTGRASARYFGIPYYSGTKYTPLPGDLFFTKGFTHVGIVYDTDGEYFYCIEGNANTELSVDGYYVIINKRKISDYYFGVPAYEGCDKNHDYVKGQETTHPHRTYYQCKTCGDQFYTGYDVCVASCGSCFSCGCTAAAGYYLCTTEGRPLNVRSSHGTGSDVIGGVPNGAVVYVHGVSSSWASIEYDGLRGHVLLSSLKKYYPAPSAPEVRADRDDYVWGDNVQISWTEAAYAEEYRLRIYRDGTQIEELELGLSRSYQIESAPAGAYTVQVTAGNKTGTSKPAVLNFTVRDTYTVTYDARDGSGTPEAQTQAVGDLLLLSSDVPTREGYTFLGWTKDSQGNFAQYKPGDTFIASADTTLYAVWKDDTALLQELTIEKMPIRTYFLVGEELDTAGLELRAVYSDGSGHLVSGGFTPEGFSSGQLGAKTVTITYETMSVTYDVKIVAYIPGDINLDKAVNRDDVMQLLWHITFPDKFPIEVPADFTGDDAVNRDDVMQLLWHITFPERFPLELPDETEGTDSAV